MPKIVKGRHPISCKKNEGRGETLVNFGKKVSAEKNRKGDHLVSSGFVGYVKVKNVRGDPLGTFKKFRKKKSHSAEKIQRWDPLGTSGFVGFLEEVKNERWDPLHYVSSGPTWP